MRRATRSSDAGERRKRRRAGVLKNRSRTATVVPGARAAAITAEATPPSTRISCAVALSCGRLGGGWAAGRRARSRVVSLCALGGHGLRQHDDARAQRGPEAGGRLLARAPRRDQHGVDDHLAQPPRLTGAREPAEARPREGG